MNKADKSKIFPYMSAASQRSRQTKARNSCICLPPVKEAGRQIQDYPVYICRQSMSQADKSKISLLKLPAKKIEAVFQNSPYGKIYILMESRRKLRRSGAHGIYRVSERDKRIQDR
jgi:hypothetical protein